VAGLRRNHRLASIGISGCFASERANLRRERQLEGIKAAKERGVYKGRQPSVNAAEVRRLYDEEKLRPVVIARRLGIGRSSVYRALGAR
jgi:DNA invertase Pin-like site-specific DNA recombinase